MTMQRLFANIRQGSSMKGVSHTNKFIADIFFPTRNGVITDKDAIEGMQLRCQSASMPGLTFNVDNDLARYGPPTPVAKGITYDDATFTFLADDGFYIRKLFHEWQKMIYDQFEDNNLEYLDNYVGSVHVYSLTPFKHGHLRNYGVRILDAFPKALAAQEFSMDATSDLQKISVTFGFRRWVDMSNNGKTPQLDAHDTTPGRLDHDTTGAGDDQELGTNPDANYGRYVQYGGSEPVPLKIDRDAPRPG